MPKRTDIESILIIGAGPIIIGQACEFDYSGTQAVKALKEEGYRVILVNSNPATIMTDPQLADATYIEPITPEVVERIIEKERPDALLPTMGGQTALNTALTLERSGVLARYGVEMIGARADVIDKAEDRELFRKAMEKIGLDLPRSAFVNTSELKRRFRKEYEALVAEIHEAYPEGEERERALREFESEWLEKEWIRREEHRLEAMRQTFAAFQVTGLPAIVRPSFTLGGTGGGIAYTLEELYDLVLKGIEASPTSEVLIEESIIGWKEYEMEVVRDKDDNCIIVCSIENVDPMGVHTGDSITVAPALTLTDKEYQRMRNAAIAVLREIGVETGGSNVQFAINPKDGRMVVIEMNPRVSRSSALASKATGFPIARVAAKLAIGYTLDELENDITKGATPASFEPTIDYVVTKVPRFAFEKFPGAEPVLTTSMKSVGEVMAIGRTFHESFQKALRGLETGLTGLDEVEIPGLAEGDGDALRAALSVPTPDRLLKVAQALRQGASVEDICRITRYDPWFIERIAEIVAAEERVKAHGLPEDAENMRWLKAMGFSDARLAKLTGLREEDVRAHRWRLGVRPVYKRIDTCAAEFASPTAYMYSTYETGIPGLTDGNEAFVSDREKVVILGGGPNRIGQGIEFDYCCCHASFALKDADYETIMVNCNPETVSTDFDTSDRLYFEPLTTEDVLEILHAEQQAGTLKGVIVQFGGQTPLKLSQDLQKAGIPILGTSPDAIDLAEDRDRFSRLLKDLGLRQPDNGIARSAEEAVRIAEEIGYPVVIRPSYVLGGRAMEIVRDREQLERYISEAVVVSGDSPVLIDSYLVRATEVDVDVLADAETVYVAGIMEHIEEAGIHSGDSACSLPPYALPESVIREIERQSRLLAQALDVRGLMNVQYAVKGDIVYILEVNPRASRTVPFVAKATGVPIAKLAARVMAGELLSTFGLKPPTLDHVSVKEAVFPFNRFPGVDTLLGPEMRSTGEVMGIDSDFPMAYAKAQLAAGQKLPLSGTVFISVRDADKPEVLEPARALHEMGFSIIATGGTAAYLKAHGVPAKRVNKVREGRPHIVDAMANGEVQLVINTTEGAKAQEDSRSIRQQALISNIPYTTTVAGAKATAAAIAALKARPLEVRSLQGYIGRR